MKWFFNMKTAAKLISAFVLVSAILAGVGYYGLSNLNKLNNEMDWMYNERLVPIHDVEQAQVFYQRLRVNVRDFNFISATDESNKKYHDTINDISGEIESRLTGYENSFLSDEEKEILDTFKSTWAEYKEYLDKVIETGYNNDTEEYLRLSPEFLAIGNKMEGAFEALIEFNIAAAEKSYKDADEMYTSSRNITIAVIVISFILSITLGYVISRIIAKPLGTVATLLRKVANGDLTETVDIHTKDEIGQLAKSTNDMIVSLRETVSHITESASSVAIASEEISATTEEIASGSTNQADDTQRITSLFKELSAAIDSVAINAESAAELSTTMLDVAKDGNRVVELSISGMKQINIEMTKLEEDSKKIGEIIGVIDDIAAQTNLLALNAAIEAARAGDHGKGFAVVADEVRKLAERSADATKQVSIIIKGMQTNTQHGVSAVTQGVELTERTGESFRSIAHMVNESAGKASEIAAACEEQVAQTSDVMSSIESIASASEEAATAAEETAATSQSLARLAEDLNKSVSIFKI